MSTTAFQFWNLREWQAISKAVASFLRKYGFRLNLELSLLMRRGPCPCSIAIMLEQLASHRNYDCCQSCVYMNKTYFTLRPECPGCRTWVTIRTRTNMCRMIRNWYTNVRSCIYHILFIAAVGWAHPETMSKCVVTGNRRVASDSSQIRNFPACPRCVNAEMQRDWPHLRLYHGL